MREHSQFIKQILLFGLVGGGSLLIDVCVTTFLFDVAHLPAYLASGIGFLSAFFFNFPINRKHVFNHSKFDRYSMKTQIALYATLSAINLLASAGITQLFVSTGLLMIGIAKIAVTAIIAVWNFFILKYVIFAKRPSTDELDGLILQ